MICDPLLGGFAKKRHAAIDAISVGCSEVRISIGRVESGLEGERGGRREGEWRDTARAGETVEQETTDAETESYIIIHESFIS